MTIPDEAVQAEERAKARAAAVICEVGALCGWPGPDCKSTEAAQALFDAGMLTAAAPFLQVVKVKALEWREDKLQDGRKKWLSSEEVITETHPSWENQGFHLFYAAKTFDTLEAAKAAAQADYEARILSAIDVSPSPRAQALEALFDAVTLMQKHDEKFEGEIPLATIQKVYAAHTAAMRALSQGTSSERAQALEEALRKMVALYESERDPGDYGFQRPDWLLAALSSQPVADGWLPIETAPKDGTVIDLWSSEFGRQPDCFWGKREHHCGEAGQYCDSDWHSEPDAWIDSAQNTQTFDDITHWHPLPASPRSSCACCEN